MLVHLNDPRRASLLLAPALTLAARFESHVVGLHVYGGLPPLAAGGVPYGADVVEAVIESEKREASALKTIFEHATSGLPLVAEWVSEKTPYPDLAQFVMQRGRCCDLIVASQSDATWDMAPVLDFPERLAIESGRPVMIVPSAGRFDAVGRVVAVAWNGSRESARAAVDAQPLLRASDAVAIIVVGAVPSDERMMQGARELAASLVRYGIKVSVNEVARDRFGIGEALLEGAASVGADLLVMGGYGHSRFRELIFGGATRYVLHNLSMPVLLSH
ncbi:MAG: universal stress protein [Hyphomicrobiaceae bacterium]